MEKINVAELLKNCPKGMELDCINYNGIVSFEGILDNDAYPIKIKVIYNNECNIHTLTKYGQTLKNSYNKCVIFPKGKTTWEGFQRPFKDGDIIFTHANCLNIGLGNTWISIFQEYRNGGVATYVDYAAVGQDYYDNADGDKGLLCMEKEILRQRLATEEEKQRLFKAIKDNGYKWNAETKTLEKLIKPKFKVGNKVRNKNNPNIVFTITSLEEDYYACGTAKALWFDDQDKYAVIHEPKFKVGDRIRKKGDKTATFTISDIGDLCYYCGAYVICNIFDQDDYELVPNKFDISTLKPFDKVLVRDHDKGRWDIHFYELYDNTNITYPYRTLGGNIYKQCIPYKGNEHLMGLIKECDDYYKTWINEEN